MVRRILASRLLKLELFPARFLLVGVFFMCGTSPARCSAYKVVSGGPCATIVHLRQELLTTPNPCFKLLNLSASAGTGRCPKLTMATVWLLWGAVSVWSLLVAPCGGCSNLLVARCGGDNSSKIAYNSDGQSFYGYLPHFPAATHPEGPSVVVTPCKGRA